MDESIGSLCGGLPHENGREPIAAFEPAFRSVVERLPVVVYVEAADRFATALYVSPRYQDLTGYSAQERIAQPDLWTKVLHPDDRDRVLAESERTNSTGEPFDIEYRLVRKDGTVVWVHDHAYLSSDPLNGEAVWNGVLTDITEAKLAQERIAFLAYHDGLTGLPNQALFVQLAELAVARARRADLGLAMLSIDIDRFRLANETLGIDAGERLLVEVAERLGATMRDTDTLARRGADDFVLMVADLERALVSDMQTPLVFAETLAGRIRDAFNAPFDVGDREIYLSVSIGISLYPDDAADVPGLLANSEAALRESKRSGFGGFATAAAGVGDGKAKLAYITDLRRAAERDEWVLHYQPIVRLTTGHIEGVEALVRWRRSDGEIVLPGEFIPLAEELGLIEGIGDWVVAELVRQDKAWAEEGLNLQMGFNLSPRQFWQPDLAERILRRLDAEGMDPAHVVVEITETSAMRDPDLARAALSSLHSRGLRVAIDDFGTGYSSLSRLRSLPVDVLKIDRSFVNEMDRDRATAKIVAAFVQLGQGLGMTTLAEGIETEEQLRILLKLGCELGQGYHFSKPVPAPVISERFRAGEILIA